MAAADDPPLTTIEPHLEMSYNRVMPGEVVFAPSAGTVTAAHDRSSVVNLVSSAELSRYARSSVHSFRSIVEAGSDFKSIVNTDTGYGCRLQS